MSRRIDLASHGSNALVLAAGVVIGAVFGTVVGSIIERVVPRPRKNMLARTTKRAAALSRPKKRRRASVPNRSPATA